MEENPIPAIVDIDADTSDIPALIYLLEHPKVSVEVITISCGITYIDHGVDNMLKIIDYLGYEDILVAGGSDSPLETNYAFPTPWREGSNNTYGVSLPTTDLQPSDLNASQLIISQLKSKPMTIISTGPLTNLGRALRADDSIVTNITRLYSMGGAVFVDGNVGYESDIPNYAAEWNYYVDPHAADIVLRSGIPITLVPLDATNDVRQTVEFQDRLASIAQTDGADIVLQMYIIDLYFWDQLTAVAVTNPEVITIEDHHISIVIDEVNHEGQTITNATLESNTQVAISADTDLFEELFLATINDGVIDIHTGSSTSSSASETAGLDIGINIVMIILLTFGSIWKRIR